MSRHHNSKIGYAAGMSAAVMAKPVQELNGAALMLAFVLVSGVIKSFEEDEVSAYSSPGLVLYCVFLGTLVTHWGTPVSEVPRMWLMVGIFSAVLGQALAGLSMRLEKLRADAHPFFHSGYKDAWLWTPVTLLFLSSIAGLLIHNDTIRTEGREWAIFILALCAYWFISILAFWGTLQSKIVEFTDDHIRSAEFRSQPESYRTRFLNARQEIETDALRDLNKVMGSVWRPSLGWLLTIPLVVWFIYSSS